MDLDQKNLGLEDSRHAAHRFSTPTTFIGEHGSEEGSSRITLRDIKEEELENLDIKEPNL